MPDFNPDKEAHRDHRWIVHKSSLGKHLTGVNAAERDMPFNHEGRFSVSDEAVAAEIRMKYPRAVTVSRVSKYHPSDRGHIYHFSVPEMPWHKKLPNAPPPTDHDFDSADLDSPQG
jgi:hypothetical protein